MPSNSFNHIWPSPRMIMLAIWFVSYRFSEGFMIPYSKGWVSSTPSFQFGHSRSDRYLQLRSPGTGQQQRHRETVSNEDVEEVVGQDHHHSTKRRGEMQVKAEIELPFSAYHAFDAYSDLPRQPSWSPWLKSVEYVDEDHKLTKWIMRTSFGLKLSWYAVSTTKDRPRTIAWETTGASVIQNSGRVEFTPIREDLTHMKLTMAFQVPTLLSYLAPDVLKRQVEKRMLASTLRAFRDVVVEDIQNGRIPAHTIRSARATAISETQSE